MSRRPIGERLRELKWHIWDSVMGVVAVVSLMVVVFYIGPALDAGTFTPGQRIAAGVFMWALIAFGAADVIYMLWRLRK